VQSKETKKVTGTVTNKKWSKLADEKIFCLSRTQKLKEQEILESTEKFKEEQKKVKAEIELIQFKRNCFEEEHLMRMQYPSATRRHGNFAGVHTLLRILLSSNSALLIKIITGVSPLHFDFVVYYVLCQC
jgi:hypothetical protein